MKKVVLVIASVLALASTFFANAQNLLPKVSGPAIELLQKAGDSRSSAKFQQDCAAGLALDSCAKSPTPPGCPAGKHWVTTGTGIAHCVDVDPPCPSPNNLVHDAVGNPTCMPPVITYDTQYRTVSCPSGYEGYGKDQERTLTYTNGVLTSTGSWWTTYNDCTAAAPPPPPPAVCSNGATNYPTCTLDTPPAPTVCSNGASNYPTCTFDTPPPTGSTCTPADSVVSSTPCGVGEIGGPIQVHQTISCPGSVTGSYTSGTCTPAPKCANGATNYPACNLGIPEQPVTCTPWKSDWNYSKMCQNPEMEFEEPMTRTCSDGTTQTEYFWTNWGPCH